VKEPQRLKDLPVTYHDERAETSAFNALCEFYHRSVSYSLADSSVADQRCASVPAASASLNGMAVKQTVFLAKYP
jgi:hypothetical protein